MSLDIQSKIVNLEFSNTMVETIKNMYFKDSSDEEFQVFLHVCKKTGLDPTMRQIHPVKRAGRMTIQTGIDGFRLIAERTGRYAPGKEPTYAYDEQGKIVSATSFVKKQTPDGTWHDVSATAFWSEYVQVYNGKPSQFWAKMPHTMLAKVAECIALRKAFPADLSGIYSHEEMAQADSEMQGETNDVKPEKVEEDIHQNEVESYLEQNWNESKQDFRSYMEYVMKIKKWNFKTCLEQFTKEHEKIKEHFIKWIDTKNKKVI